VQQNLNDRLSGCRNSRRDQHGFINPMYKGQLTPFVANATKNGLGIFRKIFERNLMFL